MNKELRIIVPFAFIAHLQCVVLIDEHVTEYTDGIHATTPDDLEQPDDGPSEEPRWFGFRPGDGFGHPFRPVDGNEFAS